MQKGAVIFDFNRTLFDPTVYALYHGVIPMLEELKQDRDLVLFSRKGWDRGALLEKLGIASHFRSAHFVEKKTPENLRAILDEHGLEPSECIIVGDMLSDEICVGSELGMKTVWFQQSRFGSIMGEATVCAPQHTVQSISELHELLRKI